MKFKLQLVAIDEDGKEKAQMIVRQQTETQDKQLKALLRKEHL